MMRKFWVVHNIPSPYRLHIFNSLWKECAKRDLDFHVHFMSNMSRGYAERPISWRNPKMDFPYTYWKDYGIGQRHANPGLLWHLYKNKPDFLLAGSPFDTLTGMLAGRIIDGCSCTWCEGNARRPGRLSGVLGRLKVGILSSYKYVAVPGNQGVRYIELLQKKTKKPMPKCLLLPNLVNEELFDVSTMRLDRYNHKGEAFLLRQKIKCDDLTKLCLVPSRLDRVKGVSEFLSLLTPRMLEGWKIVVAGDGPLRSEVDKIIAARHLDASVIINGFVKYDEMPILYAASDLLLLPSLQDQNPLAVVEGLHSGLPVAVSEMAGNVDEAVDEGGNGWILPVNNRDRYLNLLENVFSSSTDKLRAMGRHSVEKNAIYWKTADAINRFLDGLTA